MKTLLVTLTLVVGSALQMNAQLDHEKNETNYTPPPSEMNYSPQNSHSNNPIFGHIAGAAADKYDYVIITTTGGAVIKEVPLGQDPLSTANLKTGSYIVCIYSKGKVIRKRLEVQ